MMDARGDRSLEPRWYAVQTKPRQEERVQQWLHERSSLTVFLPRVETVRRRHHRRVAVVEPFFPSYLFVRMPLDPDAWYTVKWSPGVRQVVCTGDVPTPVPPEAMLLLLERFGERELLFWRPVLRPGEPVRVIHGPLAGLEGVLEGPCSRGDRVRVLLRLLSAATPVELDIADIEIAS